MPLPAGALRAAAGPGFARAVAVFSFTVALSTQPVRCVRQHRPPLRYRGLLMRSWAGVVLPSGWLCRCSAR